MSDINLKGFDSIKAEKKLIERTIYYVAHPEPKSYQTYIKRIAVSVISLLVLFGGYYLFNNSGQHHSAEITVTDDGGVKIPAIPLPKNTGGAKMMGLIVYNGKIYEQAGTTFNIENAKSLLGEKLGTTKGNLNEWSKQDEFSVEFASSIGIADVYTVKGYDPDFRIMAYSENDGDVYAEFFEHLNGITIHDGKDIFGQLKMNGKVKSAKYQTFSDWDNSKDNYYPVDSKNVNSFIEALNDTKPYTLQSVKEKIGDFRNDKMYRDLVVNVSDRTKVSLVLIKGGYIRYGYTNVYFKMDDEAFQSIWDDMG